jgi:DNA polymerase-3 subunit epsilon
MKLPKKMLYFDVETTGLNPAVHEIIQLSGIIEWDGQEVDRFDFRVKPRNFDVIDPKALEVTGLKIEDLEKYPDADLVFLNLKKTFDRHINRYDKIDKFIPVAHNGKFDMDFLNAFFVSNHDPYFGSWVSWNLIDTMAIARYLFIMNNIPIEGFKLEHLCRYFDIPLDAHDSMNDIVATREVLYKMNEIFGFKYGRVG